MPRELEGACLRDYLISHDCWLSLQKSRELWPKHVYQERDGSWSVLSEHQIILREKRFEALRKKRAQSVS
jgi:methionine aminopeptidase